MGTQLSRGLPGPSSDTAPDTLAWLVLFHGAVAGWEKGGRDGVRVEAGRVGTAACESGGVTAEDARVGCDGDLEGMQALPPLGLRLLAGGSSPPGPPGASP